MPRTLILLALAVAGCGGSATFDNADAAAPPDFSALENVDASPLGQACDVMKQKGCPDGMHCTVGSAAGETADVCVPDPVTAIPAGGHCNPFGYGHGVVGDLCEPGLVCAVAGSDTQCLKPCFVRSECSAGEACVADTGSPTTRTDPVYGELPLSACLPSAACDPITQAGCDDGFVCRYTRPDTSGRSLVCKSKVGSRVAGGDCDSSDDCAAGFICTLNFCRRLCYFDPAPGGGANTHMCPADEGQCSPISGGGEVVGRCL
jgi:hypothetical protein